MHNHRQPPAQGRGGLPAVSPAPRSGAKVHAGQSQQQVHGGVAPHMQHQHAQYAYAQHSSHQRDRDENDEQPQHQQQVAWQSPQPHPHTGGTGARKPQSQQPKSHLSPRKGSASKRAQQSHTHDTHDTRSHRLSPHRGAGAVEEHETAAEYQHHNNSISNSRAKHPPVKPVVTQQQQHLHFLQQQQEHAQHALQHRQGGVQQARSNHSEAVPSHHAYQPQLQQLQQRLHASEAEVEKHTVTLAAWKLRYYIEHLRLSGTRHAASDLRSEVQGLRSHMHDMQAQHFAREEQLCIELENVGVSAPGGGTTRTQPHDSLVSELNNTVLSLTSDVKQLSSEVDVWRGRALAAEDSKSNTDQELAAAKAEAVAAAADEHQLELQRFREEHKVHAMQLEDKKAALQEQLSRMEKQLHSTADSTQTQAQASDHKLTLAERIAAEEQALLEVEPQPQSAAAASSAAHSSKPELEPEVDHRAEISINKDIEEAELQRAQAKEACKVWTAAFVAENNREPTPSDKKVEGAGCWLDLIAAGKSLKLLKEEVSLESFQKIAAGEISPQRDNRRTAASCDSPSPSLLMLEEVPVLALIPEAASLEAAVFTPTSPEASIAAGTAAAEEKERKEQPAVPALSAIGLQGSEEAQSGGTAATNHSLSTPTAAPTTAAPTTAAPTTAAGTVIVLPTAIENMEFDILDLLEEPKCSADFERLACAYDTLAALHSEAGSAAIHFKLSNYSKSLRQDSPEDAQQFYVQRLEEMGDANLGVVAKAYQKLAGLQLIEGHTDKAEVSQRLAKQKMEVYNSAQYQSDLSLNSGDSRTTMSRRKKADLAARAAAAAADTAAQYLALETSERARLQKVVREEEEKLRHDLRLKLQAYESELRKELRAEVRLRAKSGAVDKGTSSTLLVALPFTKVPRTAKVVEADLTAAETQMQERMAQLKTWTHGFVKTYHYGEDEALAATGEITELCEHFAEAHTQVDALEHELLRVCTVPGKEVKEGKEKETREAVTEDPLSPLARERFKAMQGTKADGNSANSVTVRQLQAHSAHESDSDSTDSDEGSPGKTTTTIRTVDWIRAPNVENTRKTKRDATDAEITAKFDAKHAALDAQRAAARLAVEEKRKEAENAGVINKEAAVAAEKEAKAAAIIEQGKKDNRKRLNATILIAYCMRRYLKQIRKLKLLSQARDERERLKREKLLLEEDSIIAEMARLETEVRLDEQAFQTTAEKKQTLIKAELAEAERLKKLREAQKKALAIRKVLEEKDNEERKKRMLQQRRRSVVAKEQVARNVEDHRKEMADRIAKHRSSVCIQACWRRYIVISRFAKLAKLTRDAEIFERRQRHAVEQEKNRRDLSARAIQRFYRYTIKPYYANKEFMDAARNIQKRKQLAMERLTKRKGEVTPTRSDTATPGSQALAKEAGSALQRAKSKRSALLAKKKAALPINNGGDDIDDDNDDSGKTTPTPGSLKATGTIPTSTKTVAGARMALQGGHNADKAASKADELAGKWSAELTEKVGSLEKDLFVLRGDKEVLQSERDKAFAERDGLQSMITEVTWRYSEAEKAIDALTDDLNLADKQHMELQQEFNQKKRDWDVRDNDFLEVKELLLSFEKLSEEAFRQKECESMAKEELAGELLDVTEKSFHALGYSRFLEEQLFEARRREKLLNTSHQHNAMPQSGGLNNREPKGRGLGRTRDDQNNNGFGPFVGDSEENAAYDGSWADAPDPENDHNGGGDYGQDDGFMNQQVPITITYSTDDVNPGSNSKMKKNKKNAKHRQAHQGGFKEDFGNMFATDAEPATESEIPTSKKILSIKEQIQVQRIQRKEERERAKANKYAKARMGLRPAVETRESRNESLESDPSTGSDSDGEYEAANEGNEQQLQRKAQKVENDIRIRSLHNTEKVLQEKAGENIAMAEDALFAYKVAAVEEAYKEEEERLKRLTIKLKETLRKVETSAKDREVEFKEEREEDLATIQRLLQRNKMLKIVRSSVEADSNDVDAGVTRVKGFIEPQKRTNTEEPYSLRKQSPFTQEITVSTPFSLLNSLLEVANIEEYFCASIGQMRELIEAVLVDRGELETAAVDIQNKLDDTVAIAIENRKKDRGAIEDWIKTFRDLTGNDPEPEDKRNSMRFKQLAESYKVTQLTLSNAVNVVRGLALQGEHKRYKYEASAHLVLRITGKRPAPFKYRFEMPHERWSQLEDPMQVKTALSDHRKIAAYEQVCAGLSLVMTSSERSAFGAMTMTRGGKIGDNNNSGSSSSSNTGGGGGSPAAYRKQLGVNSIMEKYPEFQDQSKVAVPINEGLLKLENELVVERTKHSQH